MLTFTVHVQFKKLILVVISVFSTDVQFYIPSVLKILGNDVKFPS